MIQFINLTAYFIFYATVGWCIEVVYATTKTGKFINRGFLNGPVCPIYGAGATLVIVCLTPIKENILILYCGSFLLTSFIEFITGLVLEKIFHQKWWDYSMRAFNLKGYVCLRFSLLWGLACLLVMRVIQPVVDEVIKWLSVANVKILITILVLVYSILIADIAVTLVELLKIHTRLKLINDMDNILTRMSESVGGKLSDETLKGMREKALLEERYNKMVDKMKAKYGEEYAEYMNKLSFVHNRLEKAFPALDFSRFDKIVDMFEEIMNKAGERRESFEKKVEDKLESIKQTFVGVENRNEKEDGNE